MKWLTGLERANKDITFGPWQKENCCRLEIKLQTFAVRNESRPIRRWWRRVWWRREHLHDIIRPTAFSSAIIHSETLSYEMLWQEILISTKKKEKRATVWLGKNYFFTSSYKHIIHTQSISMNDDGEEKNKKKKETGTPKRQVFTPI